MGPVDEGHLTESPLVLAEFIAKIARLMTIPGFDRNSACAILVERSPDMGAFGSARHCAASAGVCRGNNQAPENADADAPGTATPPCGSC